jgi:hypothetical protein
MAKRSKYYGLSVADYLRARMKLTGKTQFGCWVWTPCEDDLLKQFYPDIAKLRKLLKRRSRIAIKQRAIKLRLGTCKPRNFWTANEVRKLRLRWREATKDELLAEFPRHSWSSLNAKAHKLRLYRRPWRPKPTGHPMLDEIRQRAAQLHITLYDLDRICSSGRYFGGSSQGCEPSRNVWPKAIAALGGRIEIVWR